MKNLVIPSLLVLALTLSFCTSTKQTPASTDTTKPPTVTYLTNIKPIVTTQCAPCHFPPKGSKQPLDNYADVKAEIDDIIARIQLHPGEKGYMPAKRPRLSEETIQLFKTWKAEGTPEK